MEVEPTKKNEKPNKESQSKREVEKSVERPNLYEWLTKHDLINLNALCKKVGYDRANFGKNIASGKELKEEILIKFENELKEYGYGSL